MIEILPISILSDEDSPIFGRLNVVLSKLSRSGLPISKGIVITAPNLKLKVTLEHFDFKTREEFAQSLTLVKKEVDAIPVPEILEKETKNYKTYFLNDKLFKSSKDLWKFALNIWIEEIKKRLWRDGFYKGITEGLDSLTVVFTSKLEGFGSAYFDNLSDDTVINIKYGKVHPTDLKKIDELVREANKKLIIPHEYDWVLDKGIKFTKVKPFTPNLETIINSQGVINEDSKQPVKQKSTVKVILDLSTSFTIEKEVDGVYISSEKTFDLNKPRESFEELVFKIVESAITFPNSPILFKLADKSEGMGKVRGSLRLMHQKSLLEPMIEALDFARHKKGLLNIHIVVPFVRGVSEFLQIKRELAIKKLMRKNSLQLWLEVAVPENIVNLEHYLIAGLDGIVLNLDELISHLNGFDNSVGEVTFYKNEVDGLLKFLEDSLKLLHKSKVPFIAIGSLTLNPKVLEFLIEKGVFGIVVERYEAHSAHELLHQSERRLILGRSS